MGLPEPSAAELENEYFIEIDDFEEEEGDGDKVDPKQLRNNDFCKWM